MNDLTGKVLQGRYEIVELIGQGGMASIYRANDLRLKRNVAVKVLHDHLARDPEFLSRFLREAQAAARLVHSNIVNVYDVEEEDGINYIVMEYIEANNLKDFIFEKAPFTIEQTYNIISQISHAIKYAHENGLIHRDLKPQNVLISDNGEFLKVTDFGIARAITSSTLTQTGSMMGSVQYFSPEQAQGKPADKTTDIYSLGIILYECLTGRLPFDAENPVAIALKQVQEDAVPPSMLNKKLNKNIDEVVLKALAKEPADRYQDVEEFLMAVKSAFFQSGARSSKDLKKLGESDIIDKTLFLRKNTQASAVPSVSIDDYDEDEDEDEDEEDEKPERSSLIYLIIVLIFVTIISGIFIKTKVIDAWINPQKIPDFEGFTLEKAREIADNRGWQIKIIEERFDSKVPEGVIISQDPSAGTDLPRGGTVQFVLSKGAHVVEVPDLRGMPLERATEELTRLGLKAVVQKQVFDEKVEKDAIISHQPAALEMVSPGQKVFLVLSKGSEKMKVPDLIGLNEQDASKNAAANGFSIVIEKREKSDAYPKDSVISQTPAKDELAAKGTKIKVVLSTGQESLNTPRLVGKTISEAKEFLNPMGIKLEVGDDDPDEERIIARQEPAPGKPLSDDKTIRVWGKEMVAVPGLTGRSLEEAQNIIDKNGLVIGKITYKSRSDMPDGVVIDQNPSSGSEIERGSKVNITVSKSPADGGSTDSPSGDKSDHVE